MGEEIPDKEREGVGCGIRQEATGAHIDAIRAGQYLRVQELDGEGGGHDGDEIVRGDPVVELERRALQAATVPQLQHRLEGRVPHPRRPTHP